MDPKHPGAVDEIINFGDFWDEEGMQKNKENILNDTKKIGRHFSRAYRYLKAAASVYEDTAVINEWALNRAQMNAITGKLLEEVFENREVAAKEGKQRCLFASAITPNGLSNHLDSVVTTGKVYELRGEQGTGTERLLEKIRAAAVERGYYVECYYCALNPGKLEHLVMPEMDISFTTSNEYHSSSVSKHACIDTREYLDKAVLENYAEELKQNKSEFELLLHRAIGTIQKAKALHDQLETYYIPNIDFKSVQLCFESTLARILDYAKK